MKHITEPHFVIFPKFKGTRLIWEIQKPNDKNKASVQQLLSFSTKNEQLNSIMPLTSKNSNNKTNKTTNDSSILISRAKEFAQKIINRKNVLGKSMIFLVVILFSINFHFIIFLRIQPTFIVKNHTRTDDNNSFDEASNFSLKFEENSTIPSYDEFECAAELGSWYSNFMEKTWLWLDMFIYFMIPFLTMCITFSIIKLKLKSINRNYATILLENTSNNHNKRIYLKKIRRNRKIIKVLFGTNTYFVLSIIPYFIFSLLKNLTSDLNAKEIFYIKSLVDILFYSNNALNIFFYGFTSKEYRRAIKKMFFLDGKTKKKKSTSRTKSKLTKSARTSRTNNKMNRKNGSLFQKEAKNLRLHSAPLIRLNDQIKRS